MSRSPSSGSGQKRHFVSLARHVRLTPEDRTCSGLIRSSDLGQYRPPPCRQLAPLILISPLFPLR
jgi:hypothetical protein